MISNDAIHAHVEEKKKTIMLKASTPWKLMIAYA